MENSFLMEGDYKSTKSYTVESEAHVLSGGAVNPMQYRFKEKHTKQNDHLKKLKSMKFSRKSLAKKEDSTP